MEYWKKMNKNSKIKIVPNAFGFGRHGKTADDHKTNGMERTVAFM